MIIVVLFTLLLLAGILLATTQLSMSSMESTADQGATLQAQYTAESNLNRTRSVLKDVQYLLSVQPVTISGTSQPGLVIPRGTTAQQMEVYASNFCGQPTSGTVWTATTEFALRGSTGDPDKAYPNARVCTVNEGTNVAGRYAILADFVAPNAYNVLPARERPTNLSDRAARLAFWNDVMGNRANRLTTQDSRFRLKPSRVVKLSPAKYRFYIELDSAAAQGQKANSQRVLLSRASQEQGQWWFDIELPSFLNDVLFTNHHRTEDQTAVAPNINFIDGQVFNGSVHTNEKFLFASGNVNTRFMDSVTSAGCVSFSTLSDGTTDCVRRPGVSVNGTIYTPTGSKRQINQAVLGLIPGVQFDLENLDGEPPVPDFAAAYRPMPTNANDQRAAGNGVDAAGNPLPEGRGIVVPATSPGVEILAGDAAGNPLTSYNARSGRWAEPSPVYQYIRLYKTQSQTTYDVTRRVAAWTRDAYGRVIPTSTWYNTPTANRGGSSYDGYWVNPSAGVSSTFDGSAVEQYRVDKDGNLFRLVSGSWVNQNRKFNGMIFGDTITRLVGPKRIPSTVNPTTGSPTVDEAPPALASFSKITVAADNEISIGSDLTMSDTPCAYNTKLNDTCTKDPQNVLGIFSQNGNVSITKEAPNNLNIHAMMMSSEGKVHVVGYNTGSPRGDVYLTGGIVENWYGAFGTFSGTTPTSGYGRQFEYDQRLKEGISPPYFPVSPIWQATDATAAMQGLGNVLTRNASAGDFK
ncbi:hypothetical protein ACFP81_08945 [Deinococcus lacus]|uniref:DUF4900 domain-containing protein n=1 Tax=Deinococcus lacus TaxID=392561 RepID=A0ABW1YDE3_9DEIO